MKIKIDDPIVAEIKKQTNEIVSAIGLTTRAVIAGDKNISDLQKAHTNSIDKMREALKDTDVEFIVKRGKDGLISSIVAKGR